MNHLALFLLLPAAWLTWRWSRLVSGALWLALGTWLAYRGIRWQWPDLWTAGHLEWMRGVSMATGLVGAIALADRAHRRTLREQIRAAYHEWTMRGPIDGFSGELGREVAENARKAVAVGRPDVLAALLVASMAIDLAAMLIHRGAGQWGPQPFFQCVVLLAMCVVAWPRRAS
jgi:hypothetical protein